jgi:hypothetical protein
MGYFKFKNVNQKHFYDENIKYTIEVKLIKLIIYS